MIDLQAQSPCSCPPGSNTVVLQSIGVSNYSLQNLINTNVLPPNNFNGCIVLNGNLDIDTDYTFNNMLVRSTGESSITVKSGNTFNMLSGSYLGCDFLWSGITVEADATIIVSDVEIRDAIVGLTLLDRSHFAVSTSVFNKNHIGIQVPPNANGNLVFLEDSFRGNLFDCTDQLLPALSPITPSDFSLTGMDLNNTVLNFCNNGSNDDPNRFRNLYNGITTYRTYLDICRDDFQSIRFSPGANYLSGHGIYSQFSTLHSSYNDFDDMEFGIRAGFNSEVTNNRDSYSNIGVGVEITGSPGNLSTLENSTYDTYSQHGVAVYGSFFLCDNNSFTNQLTELTYPTGITTHNSQVLTIRDNFMQLSANQRGIDVNTNVETEFLMENNFIIFNWYAEQDDSFATGIRFGASNNGFIYNNEVHADPRIPSIAVNVNDSPRMWYDCNLAQETSLGFTYFGPDCQSTIRGNTMRDNTLGGLELNNTFVGQQIEHGNLWCNTFATIINSDDLMNSFVVDPNFPSTNFCTVLPQNNGFYWFQPSGTNTFLCETIEEESRNELIELNDLDLFVAESSYNGEFEETVNWILRSNLYNKILDYPEVMLGADESIDNFYNQNQNSELANFVDLKRALNELRILNENDIESVGIMRSELELLFAEFITIQKEYLGATDETEKDNLDQQRQLLLSNVQTKYLEGVVFQENLNQTRSDMANQLIDQYSNLNPSSLAAINEKIINSYLVSLISNPNKNFSQNEINDITQIANQCTRSGGLAVYMARSIVEYITPGLQNNYDGIDDCEDIEERSKLEENHPLRETLVYPNPSTGIVLIEFDHEIQESILRITDVLGRLIKEVELPSNISTYTLDASDLKGIYFLEIENENVLLSNHKIIIE